MSTQNKRIAVVTGANRGLGLETVRQLAEQGLTVGLAARDASAGARAADELAKQGLAVEPLAVDVTDPDSIASLVERIKALWGNIDILVNNAAVSLHGFNAEVARRTVDANFYGPLRVTDALLPLMREPGAIVMVSSGMGELSGLGPQRAAQFAQDPMTREQLIALVEEFVADVAAGQHSERGWPSSAYRVSKAALNALTRIMNRELEGRRIVINSVCPGWVRTDMGGANAPRSVEQGADTIVWAAALGPDGPSGGFFRDRRRVSW